MASLFLINDEGDHPFISEYPIKSETPHYFVLTNDVCVSKTNKDYFASIEAAIAVIDKILRNKVAVLETKLKMMQDRVGSARAAVDALEAGDPEVVHLLRCAGFVRSKRKTREELDEMRHRSVFTSLKRAATRRGEKYIAPWRIG